MKKLLLILLMLVSVGAFAQTKKRHSTKKAKRSKHSVRHRLRGSSGRVEEPVEEEKTTYPFISIDSITKKLTLKDPADEHDRPYVLINNNPYEGRLADLNPKTFTDISVIKSKGAKMIYGQKAAAGALLIETRQPLQPGVTASVLPLPKQQPDQKGFILNEEPAIGKVTDIDPVKILQIDTLIQPKFVGSKDNDTTLSVTTKVYGKKLYQWKFGTFSKAYKTYIRGRRGKDGGVNYVLNDGTTLTGGNEADLRGLLKVYNSNITGVTFTRPAGTGKNRKPATVNIELNQQVN